MATAQRTRVRANPIVPIDRPIGICHDVCGWPLFDDEIVDVAAVIRKRPSDLMKSPSLLLSVWRRFGGPLPVISRALDIRLTEGLLRSRSMRTVDYIVPAAWVARDGRAIYGEKHFADFSNNVRKGGVRTAKFIGEDPADVDQIGKRFVAQCLANLADEYAWSRLQRACGYDDSLNTAYNGPASRAALPDWSRCGPDCDLCSDRWIQNDRMPTTWRQLLHRAEVFLSQWELVRIEPVRHQDGWRDVSDVRSHDLDFWPLVDWSEE